MSREIYRRIAPQLDRVRADGGVPTDRINDRIMLDNWLAQDKTIVLSYLPAYTGNKIRTSGINSFVTKGYDSSDFNNNLTQTTALNQPHLSGNIALNEVPCLKNVNGQNGYMTHAPISFAANEKWQVTTVLNWNGSGSVAVDICGKSSDSTIRIASTTNNSYHFVNSSIQAASAVTPTNKVIGKNYITTFAAKGDGEIGIYENGVFVEDVTLSTNFSFDRLLIGRGNYFSGKIHAHIIRSGNQTASDIAYEAALFRSLIPDVETVQIGTQRWATSNLEIAATCQGNVIQEMQAAANVEKITQPINISSGWLTSNCTILNGNSFITTNTNGTCYRTNTLTSTKWYKVTANLSVDIGNCRIVENGSGTVLLSFSGTYNSSFYFLADSTSFALQGVSIGATITITTLSVQEVGWADSQNLYTAIYNQITGTTEQKTYAALKAAAMWRNVNNTASDAAIYGKLYNGFATDLIAMDITYYNVANPTTPWGYDIPAQADFETLITYLGGASVAGGKLKHTGLTYWGTPNTGATNKSGFYALPAGYVYDTGDYGAMNAVATFHGKAGYRMALSNASEGITAIGISSLVFGRSIRLIKR